MKYILWTIFLFVITAIAPLIGISILTVIVFAWFAKDDGYKKGTREDMFGNKY